MAFLALGLGTLALLLWAARALGRADPASIRLLFGWIAALGGLVLAGLLFLSGRGAAALSGAVLFGPLVWNWWQGARGRPGPGSPGRAAPSRMSRAEALQVLGLTDPVSDSDVRAAWVRLMRASHPDSGGTDWLASKVNQAKEVLLHRR